MSVASNNNWEAFQQSLPNHLRGGSYVALSQEDIKNWLVRWLQIHRAAPKATPEAEFCLLTVAAEVIKKVSPKDGSALGKFMKLPAKDKLRKLCSELLIVLDNFQIYKKFCFSKEGF